jgi:hypothetical protein
MIVAAREFWDKVKGERALTVDRPSAISWLGYTSATGFYLWGASEAGSPNSNSKTFMLG